MQAVRHFTALSQRNFAIDTHFYPLGSCTMKYNPRACNALAMLPGFVGRHPLAPAETGQAFLGFMYELQNMLCDVTGMAAVGLAPMAGAQGEFAGVAMIRAYHEAREDAAARRIKTWSESACYWRRVTTPRATKSLSPTRLTAPIRRLRRCAATRFAKFQRTTVVTLTLRR